ncbi:hypothetical protein KEM48_008180 [Puccinia striiformis f. sp. tritici PST-130]|nr:hypothetical protein KEM48_008180 [Puccinia striiformis f. sp. tritici PST-130]
MDEFKEQQRLINVEMKGNMQEVKGNMQGMQGNIQEMQGNMQEVQGNMREMKELLKMFINQAKAPENIPIPATPEPRPSARFATSTPFTSRTPGLDTTIRGNYTSRIEDSLLDSAVPSPEDSQFKSQSEIFLPVEKTKVMLDVKKLNFHFKGTEVETFIRRVEKLANLQGAGGPDVASQLPFLVSDQKISQHIEDMEGHETGNWDLLKKQLIRKWGRATPLRRFNKDSITTLISKHADKGGIQNREEYRSFVSDLEEILAYLTKMGYNDVNAGSGEPLWKAISAEMRKDVAKELAHDKKFKKTKDGIALIPNLEPLKEYVEAALLVLDLEEGLSKTPSVSKKPETKKEVKTQPKEEEATGKVSELEEEIKKLRTVLNTNQNARQLPPHMQPNFRPQNYGPPGMGPPPFPRPQFKCYYCDSTEHSSMFCPKLPEDIANKLVIRSGPNYYYPNREPIPRDTGTSVMELVHKFHEAAAQDKKTNVAYMEPAERQEPTASMISTNRWEMWSPPEMHYGKEDEENLIGFGLRRSARTNDKDKGKAPAQQPQSQPESTGKPSTSAPKASPGNQEANKNPPEPRKRRPSYPGAWVEGTSDDGSTEDGEPEIVEESLKKPEKNLPKDLEKNKRKEPEKEAEDELVLARPVEKSKVGGGLKKKIFKQSFTLTLEELLLIAPNFLQELQELAEDDGKPLSRTQNSGRCDHRDFDAEHHNNHGTGSPGPIRRSLTYACPLGFVYITLGSTKVKALVDTGAEMNIMPESLAIQLQLPLREISMNIMGMGGHSTPIVGLAEGINFSIDAEDEKAANFFIARGKVYTVLGRPFLADHKVRLELSKSRGEILSYELWDGERLCIPICSPKVPGWEMGPPRRIEERCFSIQVENYESTSVGKASLPRRDGLTDNDLNTSDDDSGLTDSDLGTTDNDSRITDDDSRTTVSELGTSSSTPSISKDDSESPEILGMINSSKTPSDCEPGCKRGNVNDPLVASQSWEDWTSKQDNPEFIRADGTHFEDCYEDKEDPWISPEHPPSSENWDTHWNPVSLFIPPEQEKEFRICGMMTANYIDQGYPVKEFLRMYPETRGSNADEIWAELPGYRAGRIGFIMLLNWTGTRGYMENDVIWPEDWWVVPIERYGMYIGDGRGLIVTKEQRMWYNSRDRTEEEEQFLSSVIAKMVALGGGFNYEAFKWALQNEQQRLGVKFETFWKEWEYSAFCL